MLIIKIIAGNLRDKNIQMHCEYCNCIYELESKDDFTIQWIHKPMKDGFYDSNIQIPAYPIICPNCEHEVYIGLDPDDHECNCVSQNCFANIIMNRPDWKTRYKTESIRRE